MHKGNPFSSKTLGKSLFHFQNDQSGHGLAGQFSLLESAFSHAREKVSYQWAPPAMVEYSLDVNNINDLNFFTHCTLIFSLLEH